MSLILELVCSANSKSRFLMYPAAPVVGISMVQVKEGCGAVYLAAPESANVRGVSMGQWSTGQCTVCGHLYCTCATLL